MDLSIRMEVIYNVKNRYVVSLSFGGKLLTSVTKTDSKRKSVSSLQPKKIYFYIVVDFQHLLLLSKFNIFLQQGFYSKEIPLVIETINFTTESLTIQNRHLNGAHSISDIKIPWFDTPQLCNCIWASILYLMLYTIIFVTWSMGSLCVSSNKHPGTGMMLYKNINAEHVTWIIISYNEIVMTAMRQRKRELMKMVIVRKTLTTMILNR